MSIKIVRGGAQWTIRKGYESILDKINPDDLHSTLNGNSYKIIKDTKVRFVISIPGSDISDGGIYIKLFKHKNYSDYVKYLFLPTKTKTEWKVANELLSKDINTALPLAIAEKRSWGLLNDSLLVTKTISNGKPLIEFCQANFSSMMSRKKITEKRNILCDLAKFIRNIHEKGFFHTDLHAGNILIRFYVNPSSLDEGYSFYLMDLHHVKILKNLSKRKKLYNLAQLFNSLSPVLTRSDELDFVKSYGTSSLGSIGNEQELLNQIESKSTRIRGVHYRSRLKRCLKESSNFSRKKLDGMRIYFRKDYDANIFLELIEKHHKALVNNKKDIIIKRDTKTVLTRVPFKNKNIQKVVVKQYKTTCGLCLLKSIFRNSTGRKSWIAGNGLLVYGHNTAKPLALIEKKRLGFVTDSYLIMEDVANCLEMDRYILKNFRNQSSSEDLSARNAQSDIKKKRTFINDFAKTVGKMHNQNVFHQDLKTCNIMVKEKDDKPFDFIFLDFDKVSFGEGINIKKRIKNLTQINLSTPRCITITDRFRFLNEYVKQCNLVNEKKNILREVINLSKTEKIFYVSAKGDVIEDW